MRLHIPSGLHALLAVLEQAVTCCGNSPTPDTQIVSKNFQARLQARWSRLVDAADQHALIKLHWKLALQERRQHIDRLSRLTRDAWIMLRRRDEREGCGGGLILLYRLPALAPRHANPVLWLEYGRSLVEGDHLAADAGHAPMVFPCAAELEDCLHRAKTAEASFSLLTLELKQVEATLRHAQRQAAHYLRCLAARLRESQFEQPPAQTRELLRSFGFRFKATPGYARQRADERLAPQRPEVELIACPPAPENPEAGQEQALPTTVEPRAVAPGPPPCSPLPIGMPSASREGTDDGKTLNWTRNLLRWARKLGPGSGSAPAVELARTRAGSS